MNSSIFKMPSTISFCTFGNYQVNVDLINIKNSIKNSKYLIGIYGYLPYLAVYNYLRNDKIHIINDDKASNISINNTVSFQYSQISRFANKVIFYNCTICIVHIEYPVLCPRINYSYTQVAIFISKHLNICHLIHLNSLTKGQKPNASTHISNNTELIISINNANSKAMSIYVHTNMSNSNFLIYKNRYNGNRISNCNFAYFWHITFAFNLSYIPISTSQSFFMKHFISIGYNTHARYNFGNSYFIGPGLFYGRIIGISYTTTHRIKKIFFLNQNHYKDIKTVLLKLYGQNLSFKIFTFLMFMCVQFDIIFGNIKFKSVKYPYIAELNSFPLLKVLEVILYK